jgi:hypothetical protein
MSDKLREKIVQHLDLCKRVGHDSKGTKLLQLALTELDKERWVPVEESLPGHRMEVLCKLSNGKICSGHWFGHIPDRDVVWSLGRPSGGVEWTDMFDIDVTHWKRIVINP